jgi:two-component system sensor histidine kinase DesK
MRWGKLPQASEKPSWGSLFAAGGAAYIFVDPYRLGATAQEWFWTSAAFAVYFALAVIAAIYWSDKRTMRIVCGATAALAIAFTAYRPSGACLFIYVAAYAPLATAGEIIGSITIIAGTITIMLAQWKLLWPPSWFPYIASMEALLVGAAITFVIRQQTNLRRALKTAEQERIARDLHDILGHTLSVIILKSELANRLLEQNPERAKNEMLDVERIARKALTEVREAIAGYRSGDLAVEIEQAEKTLATAGIAVQRDCESIVVPLAHQRVLALVLREAITNVLRHSQATRCTLSLKRLIDVYELAIHDNGRGIVGEEGNGMRGIRERIAALGGDVTWESSPGTHLKITIPTTAEGAV